ncbi:MAG TPA: penicillin-binding protein 2 [Alphaproteobacteria bacterium]|nr:penicillin-binding protein 2 [Alphaproteobacteria bacterium]
MSAFQRRKIYMSGTQQTSLEQARGRLVLMSAFFVFAYVIVLGRAADLSIIQGELQRSGEDSLYEVVDNQGAAEHIRGDIVDRNGVLLARSLKTASLYVDPVLIQEPKKVAEDLVKIFPDLSYGSLLQKLQSKKRFVWLKRNISPEDQSKILYLGYPGLNFKEEMYRIYPQGALAVHLVGASGIDGQGLSGLEAGFNDYLKTSDEPLQLTIDVRLEHVLKREMSKTIKDFNAKAGAGIIMDVETGEILAAISLPDYNPYDYNEASSNAKFNRLSLGVYELGSAFKVFSTAAYLEKTNSDVARKFDVSNPIEIGRFKIRDYHPEKRSMTVPEIFMHSSNIGSAMMGEQVGTEDLKNFYKDIGLFDAPDFEIPEVGKPLIPDPWRDVNTMTASFGHGIAVSPLQLIRAASSIVNGGYLVTPTLIAQKNHHKNALKESRLRVVSPQTSHRMRQLMRLVVTEGTGTKAQVDGFLVGGKTGTAEKPGKGGYNRSQLISSFLGVFPMDEPKYAIFVMVDEPQGNKESYGYATGGWVGAPTVARVVSGMVSVLGIKPRTEKNFEGSLLKYVKTKEQIKKEQEIEAH